MAMTVIYSAFRTTVDDGFASRTLTWFSTFFNLFTATRDRQRERERDYKINSAVVVFFLQFTKSNLSLPSIPHLPILYSSIPPQSKSYTKHIRAGCGT